MKAAVLLALVLAVGARADDTTPPTTLAAPEAPPSAADPVATALERIAGEKTIDLSTTGRKSGKLHTRPIWFVVDGGTIVVQAGKDGTTDWYRNLRKHPDVQLRQGTYHFIAKAQPVEDAAEIERLHKLFTQKYTLAWLGSFVGSSLGRGRPVVLTPAGVSTRE